jgi:hypothetical protein
MEEFLAQSRPLHGGRLIFHVGFGCIHNPFFDREMWADGRSNGLQLIARGADAVRINSRWKRPLNSAVALMPRIAKGPFLKEEGALVHR